MTCLVQKPIHMKAVCPFVNKDIFKKEKKVMCAIWDELYKRYRNDPDEGEESVMWLMAMTIEVTNSKPDLENSSDFDGNDIPTYDEF